MGRLFEWWAGQHWTLRIGVAVAFILLSTIFLLAGRFWPWGWAVGVILLLLGGPSDSEKKGYRF